MNTLTFSFFANWLLTRRRLNFILFIVSFSGSTFAAVMAIEKAPFAWLLIGLFLTYMLVKKNGRLPLLSLAKLAVPLLSVLVVFYVYFMGSRNPLAALTSVFSRAFTGGVQPAYHYLEFFPKHQDFLVGRSFPNPAGLLPFEPYRLTVEVMNWKFPEHLASGVVGSMPTVFWGELYANFGLFGVLVVPFFVGVALYVISSAILRLEKTPLSAGLLVWLILHYRTLAVTGLSGFMVDFYLWFIVLFVMTMISFGNNLKIRLCRQ